MHSFIPDTVCSRMCLGLGDTALNMTGGASHSFTVSLLLFPYKLWTTCEVTQNSILEFWLKLHGIYKSVWGEYFKKYISCILLMLSSGQDLYMSFPCRFCYLPQPGVQAADWERGSTFRAVKKTQWKVPFIAGGIFQEQNFIEFQGSRILRLKKENKRHFRETSLKEPWVLVYGWKGLLCPVCEFSGATHSCIQFNLG